MELEHIGYQVKDPVAVAAWYVKHLGFRVCRAQKEAPFTHFLADDTGRMMIEIYHNPKAPVPHYEQQDPLVLHLAFRCDDPEAVRDRLVAAGAGIENALDVTPAGDRLVILRDPWGFPIQLAKRGAPMRPEG